MKKLLMLFAILLAFKVNLIAQEAMSQDEINFRIEKSKSLYDQGAYDKCVAEIDRLQSSGYETYETVRMKCFCKFEKAKHSRFEPKLIKVFDTAIMFCDTLIKKYPDKPQGYLLKGNTYYEKLEAYRIQQGMNISHDTISKENKIMLMQNCVNALNDFIAHANDNEHGEQIADSRKKIKELNYRIQEAKYDK